MLFNRYFAIIVILAVQYSSQYSASNEDASLSEENSMETFSARKTNLPNLLESKSAPAPEVGLLGKMRNGFKKQKEKAKKLFDKTQSKVKGFFKKFKRDLNEDYKNMEKRSLMKNVKKLAGKQLKKAAGKVGEKLLSKFL